MENDTRIDTLIRAISEKHLVFEVKTADNKPEYRIDIEAEHAPFTFTFLTGKTWEEAKKDLFSSGISVKLPEYVLRFYARKFTIYHYTENQI